MPFPPCTYFPSDITGRGILQEDKGSTWCRGRGKPFPEYLSSDVYQIQDLGEVVLFLFLRCSLSKYSTGYKIRVMRLLVFLYASQECKCHMASTQAQCPSWHHGSHCTSSSDSSSCSSNRNFAAAFILQGRTRMENKEQRPAASASCSLRQR